MATMNSQNNSQKRLESLYDQSSSLYVLGYLMKDPLIFQDEKYPLNKSDFYKPLQQIIFSAIYNLTQEGRAGEGKGDSHIAPQDIDTYLSAFSAQYAFYKSQDGFQYVIQCAKAVEDNDGNMFHYYYNNLQKLSVLRDLENCGVNTTQFFNSTDLINREEQWVKLSKTSIQDILNKVRSDLVTIENAHIGKDEGSVHAINDGMRNLVAELKIHPEIGDQLDGEIINYALRGARLGKFYIYSAPSGEGKTRYLLSNACLLSLPRLNSEGQIEVRGEKDCSGYQKVCYIATEQSLEEIQTMVLAYVSGVNEKNIVLGQFTQEEESRIEKALQILEKFGSNLTVDCIPDPSIAMIKARLVKYIVQDQVSYIFYDYIFSSPSLINEFSSSNIREDVVLMMLSNSLKEIAMNYNVFIMSATQLNDGWSKKIVGFRDQNCIRGSKAIADKVDIGMVGIKMRPEEYEKLSAIWNQIKPLKFRDKPKEFKPNQVIDIYKNRRGELTFIKVVRYFDYGTCRGTDLFCVNGNYEKVDGIGVVEYKTNSLDFTSLCTLNAARRAAEEEK